MPIEIGELTIESPRPTAPAQSAQPGTEGGRSDERDAVARAVADLHRSQAIRADRLRAD